MRRLLIAGILAIVPFQLHAQGRGQAPLTGRTAAPFDITGYWVALVTDDWRYRMLTPPKGNVDYLPVNAEGRGATEAWDPAKDEASGEQCKVYGAGGVMRLPGRLHITWESDNTLRIDTDAGTQTRRFFFGGSQPPTGEPTWQGYSVARWDVPGRGRGAAATGRGQLTATTTRLRPGYLRKNGVPYSGNAVLNEYFVRLVDNGGQEYLAVTIFVDDPQYLQQPYIKTYQYKKQRDASGWNPTPCSAR
ncbi:MAG: hypothetical protein DMG11_20025 [Acidobacteria bacterium]|nr:MAG: hypothetical protein DMG11_20025 [Acidobacteriota bacterium]